MSSFYDSILSDEEEDLQSRKSIDKWIFRFFLVLLGIMPLIVLASMEEVVSPLISSVDVLSSGTKGELFTHYKALFVLIITVIVSLLFLAKIFFMNGTIRKTFLNYVLGAFVIAIVVSTIMSPNITIALNGQYNRSDGAISWLCYVALMFIAMNIEYPKNVVRYIMYAMMPFVFINLYIITMNFYGKDLLQQTWLQKLVSITLPEGASIGEGSQLLGTLNQWNYMSGMFAMMTVMYLAWAVTSKKWLETIVGAITASASIAVMFMSVSTSGFLTVVVLIPLIVIVIFRTEKKVQSVVAFATFLIIAAPVFHTLAEKDYRVWTESLGFFVDKNPYTDDVTALFENINVAYASDEVFELPILPESGWSAGSGRTYIWDKTLDLVKERTIIGYGADSLMYNFPHYNIDARSGMLFESTIVDKPHNTYVGALYGFGILGLIAIVIILVTVGIKTLKSMIAKSWTMFILAIASLAYFAQAMFNDSLPGMSAIAWLFMGMVFAMTFSKNEETITDGRNN